MSYQRINSNRYYYEISGQGDPLLLLHGFTGSSQSWQEHTAVFTQQLQTITIDILGHGRSACPNDEKAYTIANVAADIITLLDVLNIEKTNLLGYSMGGRLALYLAVFYPERFHTLILESASPGLATAVSRQERIAKDRTLADWIESEGMEAFVERWQKLPLWTSQKQLPARKQHTLRQQRLQNNPVGLANSLRGMGTGQQASLWSHLSNVQLPALLLVGELDPKFTQINQQMGGQLPQATLNIMQGAGHTIHLERPSTFQQTLLTFLQKRS